MSSHRAISTRVRPERPAAAELKLLKWVAILGPPVFLGLLELLQRLIYPDLFRSWTGYVVLGVIVIAGTLIFAEIVFSIIGRMQTHLTQQNRELLALHEAGLGIIGELDLETVLQRVVDQARELASARYGALSLNGADGAGTAFLTSGITAEAWTSMTGNGRHDVSTTDGTGRELVSLEMPIIFGGHVAGQLLLAGKTGGGFSPDDTDTLRRFATQAALAIENARLHRQVRALAVAEERERIAREMHDSLAQVLGYANAKAQAAQTLFQTGQTDRAAEQVKQLAEAARAAYADVREGILGLRTSLGPDRDFLETLRAYLDQWQLQSGVAAELELDPAIEFMTGLPPFAEVQLIRIIQEALTNVRKHATASHARVRLRTADGVLAVSVEDNGVGFVPAALGRATFPRFGLATMRERAEAVGGSFTVTSEPGHGTRIAVCLPQEPITAFTGGIHGARVDRR